MINDYSDHLVEEVRAGRLSRRDLIRRASVYGLSFGAIGSLLAACGGNPTKANPNAPAGTSTAAPSVLLDRLRNSLYLGLFAFVLVVPISIALGVYAALRRGRWPDRLLSISGLSMLALPEFVMGSS